MCRSIADGGRRCPGCQSNSPDARAEHNTRRRINRGIRRNVATWAAEQPQHGLDVAAGLLRQPPSQARHWAIREGAPEYVVHPAAARPGWQLPSRRDDLGSPADYGFPPEDQLRTEHIDSAAVEAHRAEAKPWVDSLDDAERAAVKVYTGMDYRDINAAFYAGDGFESLDSYGSLGQVARALDAAIAKAPTREEAVLVYRGAKAPNAWSNGGKAKIREWAEQAFPVGATVDFPAYLSTSRSPDTASGFCSENYGVVFEMRTRKGAYIGELSEMNDSEHEHLIGRDSQWRVVGVTSGVPYPGQTRTVVQLVDEAGLPAVPSNGRAEGWSRARDDR